MAFCREVCPWAVRQSKQWSTWRGLMIAGTVIATAINPALGLIVGKVTGAIISAGEVLKNDSNK